MKETLKAMMMPEELGEAMRQWRKWNTAKRVVNATAGIGFAVLLITDSGCAAWPWVAATFAISTIASIILNK